MGSRPYDRAVADYDRLAALDASFLHLERIETPMHVGALSVFEGAPFFDETGRFRLADARALVASRLHLIPRFRRRLMDVPLAQGRPIWVDDDRFDITYHVRLTALPNPGSRDQLLTLCSRIQAQLLDRTRPLWELWFVEGLEGGHVALIQKTHHALVDGVSGVDVATVLLDFSAEPTHVDPPPWVPAAAPGSACLLSDSLLERATQPAEMVRTARAAVRGPRRAAASATRIVRSMNSMVDRHMMAPRTSLNSTVGRNRRFDTVKVHLDGVKSVRRALGGTVNDVVLAGVAGGLRRFLQSRDEVVDGLTLKVLCPVSVRDEHEKMQLGNRVSAMFVSLPVGEPDPAARLAAIRVTTADLKEREQAVGAAFLVGLTDYAAPTLLGLGARAAHRQPFYNLIITNVPGPQVPLFCMGARMLEAYPIVPLSKNTSVVVGILSYCGELCIGLFADRDACADLPVLASAIDDSFAELEKLAEEVGVEGER
jgi:diacylglycerol O-acyltransferase